MMYHKITLDSSSVRWMKETLLSGNTLARKLGEYRNLGAGSVFSFLPSNTIPSEIENYANDCGVERGKSLGFLIRLIRDYLDKSEGGICLLENRYAIVSDPVVSKSHSQTLFLNEEVYHIIAGKETSDEAIKTAIIDADTAMSLVGICFSESHPSLWLSKSDVSLPEIENVAKKAAYIFVEAFDGGGFLIWSETPVALSASSERP